ncbi:hypothetical protein RRG08_054117 [Elysia crispata]|uniref:Uncharacterized protein n=1 Tax=Elysia crispata TaxID=231223 RepID=A0AAE0XP31_9GAST|nr:hypothetical protein RRG08_054117 [Elysia crispata]
MSDSQSEGEERKQKEQITPGHRRKLIGRKRRVWNLGKEGKHGFTATSMLHIAFKLMMKRWTDVNRLTPEQAIMYCNQNLSKLLTPVSIILN